MNDILKNVLSAVLGAAILAAFGWFFAGVQDIKKAVNAVPLIQKQVKIAQSTAEKAISTSDTTRRTSQQLATRLDGLAENQEGLSMELEALKPGIVTSGGIEVQLQNSANQAFLDIDGNSKLTRQGIHGGLMLILDNEAAGTKWLLKRAD